MMSRVYFVGVSNVNASRNIDISAGKVPKSSPSASTKMRGFAPESDDLTSRQTAPVLWMSSIPGTFQFVPKRPRKT